jgi:hypothetical protein
MLSDHIGLRKPIRMTKIKGREEQTDVPTSSWFMRETRMELVVLVRSFCGILNPFSIA